eukprot:SAG11_NODE_404_length_9736_cov_20.243022_9_plen_30_part_00
MAEIIAQIEEPVLANSFIFLFISFIIKTE